MKPYIRDNVPIWNMETCPKNTSYEAGFLVSKNSGWREIRPIIDSIKCTGCLQCYLYCPDGAIYRENGKVFVDYDFCKGCGICSKICKHDSIIMKVERQ
ncbi:MAG: 4Fe-4S binding protein [Candidatus Methanogranum gryphiswaldense]|nr:MAG: 4Fe-4S binding protein [Candidatus Methanogranum sp. U3.2.1]